MAKNMKNKVLDVNDLHVSFDTYAGEVQAVRGVTFQLHEGEVLAIVGESGCGKSVTPQGEPYKENWSKKGLSQEVSRGHSTLKRGRTEQITVFKYTKIMLIISQNVIRRKV